MELLWVLIKVSLLAPLLYLHSHSCPYNPTMFPSYSDNPRNDKCQKATGRDFHELISLDISHNAPFSGSHQALHLPVLECDTRWGIVDVQIRVGGWVGGRKGGEGWKWDGVLLWGFGSYSFSYMSLTHLSYMYSLHHLIRNDERPTFIHQYISH